MKNEFVSIEDIVITSTSGQTARMEAGKSKALPAVLHAEARRLGAMPLAAYNRIANSPVVEPLVPDAQNVVVEELTVPPVQESVPNLPDFEVLRVGKSDREFKKALDKWSQANHDINLPNNWKVETMIKKIKEHSENHHAN